ncbi:prephenate dehydratase [Teredinibacter haidensis]|uniref:prephenate dehydratase n=1 Tax=Teredinibacter haidensis TaxID=2731755 RepID=UPI000948E31B|nr:prephenate dehydratase [Teredinibacter haidensis]
MSDNNQTPNSQEQQELAELRDKIDAIDTQIGDLISARASCAQNVAEIKKRYAGEAFPNFYRPEREAQVLHKAMARNKGPLHDEEYARLFREIMSACLALENPVKVAYLGPEGTYTQQAALKHFGHSAQAVSLSAIDEVFREVASGASHYGVVPVENSTEGVVTHTLDNFLSSSVKICGEVVLRIHHHFLVSDITRTEHISRVYSHAQSLSQCRKWLDAHFPQAERIAVSSNSEAARRLKGEWNAAAIAGEIAAELYDLKSYAQNIEDQPDNSTRFLIIGSEDVGPSGNDKTSLVVSTRNEPGALHDLLEPFHHHKIDLTRVETRPSPTGTWNYVFFIDFSGHVQDNVVQAALQDVAKNVSDLKILGSYPKGVL